MAEVSTQPKLSAKSTGTPKKTATKKSSKKKKTKRQAAGRFEVLHDFRVDDCVPEQPTEPFKCEFRLLRRVLRWVKRYGVLREGLLSLYVKQQDVEKNKVWRLIDLAHCVVSYRKADQRIVMNTLDESPDLYRLQLEQQDKFKECVKEFNQHRLYRQSKMRPAEFLSLRVAAAACATNTAASSPVLKTDATVDTVSVAATMDATVGKLKQLCKNDSKSSGEIGKLQNECLTLAKEVQTKLHALLNPNGIEHLKWKSTKKHKEPAVVSEQEKSLKDLSPPPATPEPPPQQATIEQPKSLKKDLPTPKFPPLPTPKSQLPSTSRQPKIVAKFTQSGSTTPIVKTPTSTAPSTPVSTPTSNVPPTIPATPKLEATKLLANTIPILNQSGETPPPKKSKRKKAPSSPVAKDVDEPSFEEEKEKQEQAVDRDPDDSDRSEEEECKKSKMPVFRKKLPAPMGPAPSLFKILFSAVGRDIMHLSLPCAALEPLNVLQILCEELEYSELIDQAIASNDAMMRMVYVSALAVSAYGQTTCRIGRKPFNPLVGETYEFENVCLGWKFLGEQVSYHPSVSACHAEGHGWRWYQDRQFFITFGGSSAEAKSIGCIYLRLDEWNETYRWSKATSIVTGILTGKQTIDHFGDMVVLCEETKMTGKMHFKKMVKDNRGEVHGKIVDANDRVLEKMYGNWTDSLYIGEPHDSKARRIWHLGSMPPDYQKYYGFSRFAMALNEFRPDLHGTLPKSDTRLRPDQKALEIGKPAEGDKIKNDLENRQRQRKKEMEIGKRQPHQALWFKSTGNQDGMRGSRWRFNDLYWEAKKKDFEGYNVPKLW